MLTGRLAQSALSQQISMCPPSALMRQIGQVEEGNRRTHLPKTRYVSGYAQA
jgi:hypothetical protein